MAVKQFEVSGRLFEVERPEVIKTVEFPDGPIEWDHLGFASPWFHEQIGATTYRQVISWIKSNYYTVRTEGLLDFLVYYCDFISCYDFGDYSVEQINDRLSDYIPARWKSFHITDYTNSSRSSSASFVLLTNESSEVKYILKHGYNGQLKLRVGANSSSYGNTRWFELLNYSFKMDPSDYEFFRRVKHESNVFFGLEFEISTKLCAGEIQKIVTEVEPKQKPFFIFKQDSSITGRYEHKLELVTVPCTPKYLRVNFKLLFSKLEKLCEKAGGSISDYFDVSTSLDNGIHIHVDQNSFDYKGHKDRFLAAFHQWDPKSKELLQTISSRPTTLDKSTYCMFSKEMRQTYRENKYSTLFGKRVKQNSLAKRMKGGITLGKYSTVYEPSSATVEVRLYQSIFDLKHLFRCIAFTEAMFEFCGKAGLQDYDENFVPSFSKFVKAQRKFASLNEVIAKCV